MKEKNEGCGQSFGEKITKIEDAADTSIHKSATDDYNYDRCMKDEQEIFLKRKQGKQKREWNWKTQEILTLS